MPAIVPLTWFAMSDLTEILSKADSGDSAVVNEVLPLVYQELRQLAHRKLARESPDQSLQTTELVHEAYLRLVGPDQAWCRWYCTRQSRCSPWHLITSLA